MAARPSRPDSDATDDGAATTSTSTDDASTTQGAATAGPFGPDPTRVVIEQAPPEPAVFYGEGGLVPGSGHATDPNKPHVKANYQPFEW